MYRVRSDLKADWSGGFYLELGGQVTKFLPYYYLVLIRRPEILLAGSLSYATA